MTTPTVKEAIEFFINGSSFVKTADDLEVYDSLHIKYMKVLISAAQEAERLRELFAQPIDRIEFPITKETWIKFRNSALSGEKEGKNGHK